MKPGGPRGVSADPAPRQCSQGSAPLPPPGFSEPRGCPLPGPASACVSLCWRRPFPGGKRPVLPEHAGVAPGAGGPAPQPRPATPSPPLPSSLSPAWGSSPPARLPHHRSGGSRGRNRAGLTTGPGAESVWVVATSGHRLAHARCTAPACDCTARESSGSSRLRPHGVWPQQHTLGFAEF